MLLMKRYIINILVKLLHLLKNANTMNGAIGLQTYLELNVIKKLHLGYRPTIITDSSCNTFNSVYYKLDFPDEKELVFKIEIDTNRSLECYFDSTTIIDLRLLSNILSNLILQIDSHDNEIKKFFP